MIKIQEQRVWFWFAAVVLMAAVVLLLVPHAVSGHGGDWLAILPIFFVGLISPLPLLIPVEHRKFGYAPDAPQLPATFQRPPPSRLG
jgi:hypothetical protein